MIYCKLIGRLGLSELKMKFRFVFYTQKYMIWAPLLIDKKNVLSMARHTMAWSQNGASNIENTIKEKSQDISWGHRTWKSPKPI